MSLGVDSDLCELVTRLIPIVKRRVIKALDHSREDVEFELVTLSSLLTTQERLECA